MTLDTSGASWNLRPGMEPPRKKIRVDSASSRTSARKDIKERLRKFARPGSQAAGSDKDDGPKDGDDEDEDEDKDVDELDSEDDEVEIGALPKRTVADEDQLSTRHNDSMDVDSGSDSIVAETSPIRSPIAATTLAD